MAELDAGWITSIVLGVVIVVLVVVFVAWVYMRRKGKVEDSEAEDHTIQDRPPDERRDEHDAHSLSKDVNDRWDALMRSWEEENKYKPNK